MLWNVLKLYFSSHCSQSFFENMKYTDMTLVCDEREFSCHKFMLAKKSDVFDAMFSHDFKESATGRVIIKDLVNPLFVIEPSVF